MIHHFFAYIARLRYIRRWGLMRSSMSENDAEHSLQVAMLAHGMALIGKNRYGRDCNPGAYRHPRCLSRCQRGYHRRYAHARQVPFIGASRRI